MFKVGEKFLSDSDSKRIAVQNKYKLMYYSEYIHKYVIQDSGIKKPVDPLVPLPELISHTSASLLFGEFPDFQFDSDNTTQVIKDYLTSDRFVMRGKSFASEVIESAAYASAVGMNWLYMFKVNGSAYWKFIDPCMVVWEEDVIGLTELYYIELHKTDHVTNTQWYDITEFEYEAQTGNIIKSPYFDDNRYIVITKYRIKVNPQGLIAEIKEESKEETDLKYIPWIKVYNLGQQGNNYGKSDYAGKDQLFAEIDNRFDMDNYVLDENSEPWKFVPSGILDQYGNFNRKNGKTVEKAVSGVGENGVDIITWDGDLTNSMNLTDNMVKMILLTGRISPALAGYDKGGNVDSGRALKWKSIPTFSMINEKRKYWDVFFKNFIMFLTMLDDDLSDIDISGMRVKWYDGLPMDETEVVDNVVKKVNAKIMSQKTAIQESGELTAKQADDEYSQIQAEQAKQAELNSMAFAPVQV